MHAAHKSPFDAPHALSFSGDGSVRVFKVQLDSHKRLLSMPYRFKAAPSPGTRYPVQDVYLMGDSESNLSAVIGCANGKLVVVRPAADRTRFGELVHFPVAEPAESLRPVSPRPDVKRT